MALPRTLDLDLLRAFSVIAEERNISRAAERLLRNQSTVSLQLKRLEEALGQTLLERTPRRVSLTQQGETLLIYARQMLVLNDEVVDRVNEPQLTGNVRLGVPEDFATTHMPAILGEFAKSHPMVSLEVTCDLTLKLLAGYREDNFDLVMLKREPASRAGGVRVWREPLVWVAGEGFTLPRKAGLPLVVSPEPCVYRKRAIDALNRAKRPWRIAYTCGALAGAQAAVRAGLGVTVLPKDMVPPGLHILGTGGLPQLRDTEIALLSRKPSPLPVQRLSEHIVSSLERGR